MAKVFVYSNGEYDRSRWLSLTSRADGGCVLHLRDLCQPGMVSSLSSVICPLPYVKATLGQGAYQITTSLGYVLLRRAGSLVQIEFKGFEDKLAVKVSFLADEFTATLDAIERDGVRVAISA